MTIRARLGIAVCAPLLMSLVAGVAIFFSHQSVRDAQEQSRRVGRIIRSLNDLHSLAGAHSFYREEWARRQFLDEHEILMQSLSRLRFHKPEQQQAFDAIRRNAQAMQRTFMHIEQTPPIHDAGPSAPGDIQLTSQLLVRSRQAVADGVRLKALVEDDIGSILKRVNDLMFFLILLVTLPLTWMLARMMRSIIRAMATLHQGTEAVGAGNLSHRINLPGTDELASLAGAFDRMTARLQDVTVSKAALAESEQRYRGIVETAEEGIATHKPDGAITYVNQRMADMLGYSRAEIIGRSSLEFVDEEEQESVLRARAIMVEQSGSFSKERKLRRKDGSTLWTLINVTPQRDGTGRFLGYLAMHTDITERKRAEERLRHLNETLEQRVVERTAKVQEQTEQLQALAVELTQAEQRERQRLARVLHDHIQQLLVGARMQLSLVKRGSPALIQPTAQGVDAILGEALEASRSLTVELCPPILHQSGLAAALSWLARRTEEKQQFKVHVRSITDAEPAAPELRAFLFEATRELLLNAVKYSGAREAHVTMLRTKEGECRIIVEDKGRGFDSASIKPGPAGGFGLFSIQQRLIFMGGTMEIESAPGRGTRTTLTVPIGQSLAPRSEAEVAQGTPGVVCLREKGRRICVLLVDDHQIMRQGLTSLLQFESDIEVVAQAENGRQAVELARRHQPHVVIMDVNMPVMDGIQATRMLTKEMPHIKVIGLSMHLDRNAANAMREAGAVAYLTKGGPSEDLAAAIRACQAGR